MTDTKFTNTSYTISGLLGMIESGQIAIPEIQRPFVWKSSQVRDLMDSLYKGYPTGYIIVWKSPNVKLKDGTFSAGKHIIIDGQQRITAMMTAIKGIEVLNSEYTKGRIKIAFNPFGALEYEQGNPEAEIFAVQTPAHLKSKNWITDISEVFKPTFMDYQFIPKYLEDNPDMNGNNLSKILWQLKGIQNTSVGVIDLSIDLDIEVVNEIFIRINSKGTALNQGDFVMSKMAADEAHGGNTLRKIIDYFSHLSVYPTFYEELKTHDADFAKTEYFNKLAWLKDDNETVFDPECDDVIRVAFMHKFGRAKLSELVKLLSGRDFETREYKEEIAAQTFHDMYEAVLDVVSQYNFTQFMLAIKGAGFISPKMINSNMALDFAYTVFLILSQTKEVPVADIKRIVQKWYVLSILTGRYTSSPESAFAKDIKQISLKGVVASLKDMEDVTLSENFWNNKLTQDLSTASTTNPVYYTYLAAQIYFNDNSLLSNNIKVADLIKLGGDVHHIFPKKYLMNMNFSKNQYNQLANYVYLDTPVNISIGKKAPNDYFQIAIQQCETKSGQCGSIIDIDMLKENLEANCIPFETTEMDYTRYEEFLEKRRLMMSAKIRKYYNSL